MDTAGTGAGDTRARVMDAVAALDGPAVHREVQRCLESDGVDAAVVDVIVPVLHDVGVAWQSGRLGVVHEHFASSAFRGVLGELRGSVDGATARTAVLACPPHELHDLPLELFGAMLHARRWRVVSLGANTPMTALADAVRCLGADACVLAGVRPSGFSSRLSSLARLGSSVPLFVAGQGALALTDTPTTVRVLPTDLRAAADVVDGVAATRDGADAVRSGGSGIR